MEAHPPTTLDVDWRDLIGRQLDLLGSRSEDILSSPAKLGELLSICAIFVELEPIVRERATTLALQKQEIPGWTLVHREGTSYVGTDTVIELALCCPIPCLAGFMTELCRQLGNISRGKYELLGESAGLPIQAEAVKQSGATVFLRRNPAS